MNLNKNFRLNVFQIASICRNFENQVYANIENKNIKIPTYLSAGQEYISSTLSYCLKEKYNPNLFIQHRGHSTYLSFGGNMLELIDELLGETSGCANGMGGSASIHSPAIKLYGHDGMMGSQVPIAVGFCYTTKLPTIVFMGDSSAEEDYVFSSIGWALTKKLPILFIVEDNNLSILTEKIIRRNWNIHEVARGFGLEAYDISDDPIDIKNNLSNVFKEPLLLNINTNRKYWHAGAGTDGENFDRFKKEMDELGEDSIIINNKIKIEIKKLWQKQLEKQSKN